MLAGKGLFLLVGFKKVLFFVECVVDQYDVTLKGF